MGAGRSLAAKLLGILLPLLPAARRAWAEAMLRELDFIASDWEALNWALGCTATIFAECLRGWSAALADRCANLLKIQPSEEGNGMNATGKKTLGVLAGVALAVAFGVGAFFLSNPMANALLSVGIPRTLGSHLLTILLPTEILLGLVAVLLWKRKQAPVAVGILIAALGMAAHIAVHLMSRHG